MKIFRTINNTLASCWNYFTICQSMCRSVAQLWLIHCAFYHLCNIPWYTIARVSFHQPFPTSNVSQVLHYKISCTTTTRLPQLYNITYLFSVGHNVVKAFSNTSIISHQTSNFKFKKMSI